LDHFLITGSVKNWLYLEKLEAGLGDGLVLGDRHVGQTGVVAYVAGIAVPVYPRDELPAA